MSPDDLRGRDDRFQPSSGRRGTRRVAQSAGFACEGCATPLDPETLQRERNVCPVCQRHFPVPAYERVAQLLDAATFEEWFADLRTVDPLQFNDGRPYAERVRSEQDRTGMQEAAITGQGLIEGRRAVVGLVDAGFLMGSMGAVVGEKLTRAIEEATRLRLPLVIITGSAGARMHEGILSLMQMAKIAAARARHHAAGGFYVSVLTHPSFGGVAGFAFLADIVLAEPRARIGFIGPRVHEQFTHIRMPEGIQSSEFALKHGFIDRIVHRRDLRHLIAMLIRYVTV